jgi:uncharacterized membrane protein YcaP (DUF421 family)
MTALTIVFGEGPRITALQECARTLVIFFYGVAVVRLLGRRIFGKWAALDIVVAIIIGSNLSRTLTGSAPFLGTLLATTVLILLHWLAAQGAARSRLMSRLFEGLGTTLAEDGRLDRDTAVRFSVSEADINEALHQSGAAGVEDTRRMILEPSGKITVLRRMP